MCTDVSLPGGSRAGARPPAAQLMGAVLAGGEGRRFGRGKADAEVAGISMVRRAVGILAPLTPDVVVISSLPVDAGVPVLPDRVAGKGPLGGLDAALREAGSRGRAGVLLLACDLPLVGSELLASLVRAGRGAPAAAPERQGGGIEPLCSVWGVETLEVVERRLSGEDLSLHGLFREVGGRVIAARALAGEADQLLNVNTQDDRRRAEALLRRPGGGVVG